MKKSINELGFDNWVIYNLKTDEKLLNSYMQDVLESFKEHNNIEILLSGLKHIAKAKGWTYLEKQTGITRQSFYGILSKDGNPRIKNFITILKSLGCGLEIKLLHSQS